MAGGDAAAAALGSLAAYVGWDIVDRLPLSVTPWPILASALGWVFALLLVHGYSALAPHSRMYSLVSVGKASVLVIALGLGAFFFAPSFVVNRPSVLLSAAAGAAAVVIFRATAARLLLHRLFATPALLITASRIEGEVSQALDQARFEYRILEWIPVMQRSDDSSDFRQRLSDAVERHSPMEVLIGSLSSDHLAAVAEWSVRGAFTVRRLSTVLEQYLARVPLDQVDAEWILGLPNGRLLDRPIFGIRRCLDVFLAAALCLPLLILLPFLMAAIRLDSPGPLYLRQRRVGQFGREFALYKFRTMRADAEAHGAQWSSKSDARITRVGRILRKIRLDELPQVINILKGEMSFIGPRPERPEFVQLLEAQLPHYRARLLARPGLTGWAQVKSGYAASVSDSARKLEYDLYYVKYRGLRLDLQVLMLTLFVVLGFRGR